MSFAALCDAMAAILGMKYGKIKNYLNKSLEGSLMFLLTGIPVIDETIEVTIAMPAEGPSFGVAPSGTCT